MAPKVGVDTGPAADRLSAAIVQIARRESGDLTTRRGPREMSAQLSAAALEETFIRCRDMDASLEERLHAFAIGVRDASPVFADAVDRLIGRLRQSRVGETSPAPGEPMPDFLLPDDSGRLVSLLALVEKGPAAIVFHRGHWCPYCRINTDALSRVAPEIARTGGQIVAIMPDRQRFSRMLKLESEASFPILTDLDNAYALSLNLVFAMDEDMRSMIRAAGWDIAAYQGNDTWLLPVPATFVVGRDGIVRRRHIDPDYRRRMSIEDLLEAFSLPA